MKQGWIDQEDKERTDESDEEQGGVMGYAQSKDQGEEDQVTICEVGAVILPWILNGGIEPYQDEKDEGGE